MDGVPRASLDSTALNLFLNEEAATEACNVGIEEIDRSQCVILVEVVMNISLENVIEFLL